MCPRLAHLARLLSIPRCSMRRIVTVSVVLLLLVGCGKSRNPSGTLSGKVTYKGQPVNGATLLLYPTAAGQGAEFPIPVAQDGTFRTSDVPLGNYKVVVQPSAGDPGPSTKGMTPDQIAKMKEKIDSLKTPATIPIPDKYKQKEKTDLTVNVTGGSQQWDPELKD
jgi:hypothetical protein